MLRGFWGEHVCKECGYPVVVTQGKVLDYRYYCSNPDCKHHEEKEDLGDMEEFPVYCVRDGREQFEHSTQIQGTVQNSSLLVQEYAEKSKTTAIYPEAGTGSFRALVYALSGLSGEVGEVMETFKKHLRSPEARMDDIAFRDKMANELGDVAWYLAAVCYELGLDMDKVFEYNLTKLRKRQENNELFTHSNEEEL